MEKGYSIPIIDISSKTSNQIIVDKEDGVYLGHPTTVLLEDNKTMVIVYPKHHGSGQIVLKRSEDAGLTWSERLPVPDNWSSSLEVPTIYRMTDADDVERLVMFSGLRPIRMSYSEDDGITWTPLAPIGEYGGVVAIADIVNVGKGQYIAMFHDDGRFITDEITTMTEVYAAGEGADRRSKLQLRSKQADGTWSEPKKDWRRIPDHSGDKWTKIHTAFSGNSYADGHFILYQIRTNDGGLTWSDPEPIATHPTAQLCEPAIIRSPDGNQLTVLLRENSRKHNGFRLYSNDNGVTWSDPIELPGALTGDRHCARYLKDGRLFISFRDTTLESPTHGDWAAWVGTYDDIISGREGQYRVRIMKNYNGQDCAYPAVEILPDGTIVTTTYGHWTKGEEPYIVSVRINADVLDGML